MEMGIRSKIAKVLLKTATLAVKLKHRSVRRDLRRAVSRELHIKQFGETEDKLTRVLTPVFEGQVRSIAEGLREIDGGKSEEWLIQKYLPGQPRDDHGRFTSGGGAGGRVARARRTHKPSTAKKQRLGEAEQGRLAGLIGGRNTDDNAPFDVIVRGKHGVEVKTVMDNNNDKITVHPKSRRRKERRAKEMGYQVHTVAIDVRGDKRSYYHKQGVGAFRLSSMDKVSISQLKGLLGVEGKSFDDGK